MYCRFCLYDLSRTEEPRCPECGCAFKPSSPDSTTLPTNGRLAWIAHHIDRITTEGWWSGRRSEFMFCRTCFNDLRKVAEHRCPVCRTLFDRRDPSTFRRGDHLLTRLHERFRHICIWRGVLLAGIALAIGVHAVLAERTMIFGRGMGFIWIEGTFAVAIGTAWLGLALALNMHYLWGRVEPTWRFSELGTTLGVIVMTGGIVYGVISAFFFG